MIQCASCGADREWWLDEVIDHCGPWGDDETCCEDLRVGDTAEGLDLLNSLPAERDRRRFEASLDEPCDCCGYPFRDCHCGPWD